MTETRTPTRRRRFAYLATLALLAGCGGTPSEVDTAETIRPEPAKTIPTPAPSPETAPAPEATPAKGVEPPKG
jgi:ABC-type uncharacterized transport system auxiliary subunit